MQILKKTLIIMACALTAVVGEGKEPNKYTPKGVPQISDEVVVPAAIAPGAKIAIITPASYVDSTKMNKALAKLVERGYEPVVYPHAYGRQGSYAGDDQQRADDLMAAFADPEIAAIMCTRGGYGSTRMLPLIDWEKIKSNPKWLIGYSDVSALHALMRHVGIASIHGPMVGSIHSNMAAWEKEKARAEKANKRAKKKSRRHRKIEVKEYSDTCLDMLFNILEGGLPYSHSIDTHPYSKRGTATGRLVGGNMIVVNELTRTPYDVMDIKEDDDAILFIEEVGEKIYAVERMLLRMHLSGELGRFKGVIFGDFTEYNPDEDFYNMYQMLYRRLKEWGYYDRDDFLIVFGLPAGHGKINYPVVCGATTTVTVTPEATTITFDK